MDATGPHPLLKRLGGRVRALRTERAWTRRQLAEESGLSERFMADLEAGKANISVVNLGQLAEALGVRLTSLLEEEEPRSRVISLLGLRGAGKSTVGAALARKLKIPFFELDRLAEAEAGMTLAELFAMHGEDYYRRLELSALKRFLGSHARAVLATGGGVVTSPEAFQLLLDRTRTVWLRAQPEEHWDRVVHQGDLRPMRNRPHAMSELRRRLKEREPYYARAELTLSTSGLNISEVVGALAADVGS
jgi:XRE family aerobic/anaerobic benzoate catabolism transcriptional regulator